MRQWIEGILDKLKRAEPALDPARIYIDLVLGNNPFTPHPPGQYSESLDK